LEHQIACPPPIFSTDLRDLEKRPRRPSQIRNSGIIRKTFTHVYHIIKPGKAYSKTGYLETYLYHYNTGYLGQGDRAWHGVSSLLHGFKQIHRVRQIPQTGQLDGIEGLRDHQLPPGQAGWTYHQVNTGRVHAEPDPTIYKNWVHESCPSVTDGYP